MCQLCTVPYIDCCHFKIPASLFLIWDLKNRLCIMNHLTFTVYKMMSLFMSYVYNLVVSLRKESHPFEVRGTLIIVHTYIISFRPIRICVCTFVFNVCVNAMFVEFTLTSPPSVLRHEIELTSWDKTSGSRGLYCLWQTVGRSPHNTCDWVGETHARTLKKIRHNTVTCS